MTVISHRLSYHLNQRLLQSHFCHFYQPTTSFFVCFKPIPALIINLTSPLILIFIIVTSPVLTISDESDIFGGSICWLKMYPLGPSQLLASWAKVDGWEGKVPNPKSIFFFQTFFLHYNPNHHHHHQCSSLINSLSVSSWILVFVFFCCFCEADDNGFLRWVWI